MRRIVLLAFITFAATTSLNAQDYDLLIKGGKVFDGTGNPWFYADIGVRDDRIVAIGRLAGATAVRTIDAAGKVIAPGFIDLHSHADGPIYGPRGLRSDDVRRRAAPNLVAQGITTVVVNQDGRSPWPISDQKAQLERLGFGPNAILLIGHGTVRRRVMERDFRRAATEDEVNRMRALVQQGIAEGAYGISAGLEYVPGRWSTTDEVVALVEEIVPNGGVYVSHQRSEGPDPMWYWPSQFSGRPPSLIDAVRETIEIGARTGATVIATHIKAKGANYWGTSGAVVRLINEARAKGVSVYADQYPYNTTGSDGSTVLIPMWAVGGPTRERNEERNFAEALQKTLDNDSLVALLREDIAHEIARRGGADRVIVMDYAEASYVGKSVSEIANEHNMSPVDAAIALQLEGHPTQRGGARVRGFSLSRDDIEPYARQPWTATATDGWVTLPEDGPTHTRVYGTYPRKISEFAMEEDWLSVGDAIRSGTSLPAQILGLRDRGTIREGNVADLVVLNLEELKDNATFFEPHQYPSGVDFVIVNGTFVVDGGEITGELPGRIITPDTRGATATAGGSR